MSVGLSADVVGLLVPGGGDGQIGRARIVVRLVEVIEGGEGEERFGRERVNPVGDDERVALGLGVAQSEGAVVVGRALVIAAAGVVGDLEEVLPVLRVESNLIVRCLIANEGDEAAAGVGGVVETLRDRRGEAVVGARAGKAGVPGSAGGVVSERELGFAGVEIARVEKEFGFAVALESIAREDVEDAVRAIANVGAIAAALGFQLVDVFGVNLRADVGGDLGIGDGDAINEPAGLMSAADVEHVVGHIGTGDIVGNHLHAGGCRGSRGFVDHLAGDEGCGSDGICSGA